MIIESLPPKIFNLLKEIEEIGFALCLVGGFPRDYLYFNTVGKDLDFEIRPSVKIDNPAQWPAYYKKLHSFLNGRQISFSELPYLITRVNFEDVHLEFSSPRIEKNVPDNFSHHHFEATLDPDLSYDISFKRRDFTINAIGVELHFCDQSEMIVDPFDGMKDLKNEKLKNITDEFFLDSVRFLRLVRFSLKFEKFSIDETLLNNLNKFNLTNLSAHHFKEELFKSRPARFLNKFSELVLTKQLELPENFLVWTKYKFSENLSTKDEILAFVFLQSPDDAAVVARFFSMPEKRLKDLKSFFSSYNAIKNLNESDILKLLTLPNDEALKHPVLQDLKNLEEKKEWRSIILSLEAPSKLAVDWDDWSKINVTQEELGKINPAQRSYYLYYKTLKTKFSHD